MGKITEIVVAYGHENVLARNRTTFEVTKDRYLTRKGDCIIAVSAEKSPEELSPEFKNDLKRDDAKLTIRMSVGGETETVKARGSRNLTFTHPTDMVVRKSDYVCSRTLAIHADKAACDLSEAFTQKLKSAQARVEITLTVEA